jgi:hypothetical protein
MCGYIINHVICPRCTNILSSSEKKPVPCKSVTSTGQKFGGCRNIVSTPDCKSKYGGTCKKCLDEDAKMAAEDKKAREEASAGRRLRELIKERKAKAEENDDQ